MAHPHTGIVLSLKEEAHSDTRYEVDKPEDIVLSETSQTRKEKYCSIPLTGGPWSQTHGQEVGGGARGWAGGSV